MMMQTFLPSLKEKLFELTSTTELQNSLKTGSLSPEEKKAGWKQLLVLIITRLVAGVYAIALLVISCRIQFNIIGRYLYSDKMTLNESGVEQTSISIESQKQLVTSASYLIDSGIAHIVETVKAHVGELFAERNFDITQQFNPAELADIIINDVITRHISVDLPVFLSKCVVDPADSSSSETTHAAVDALLDETRDILESSNSLQMTINLVEFFSSIFKEEFCRSPPATPHFVKYAAKIESQALSLFITNNSSSNYDNIYLSQLPSVPSLSFFSCSVYSAIL